MLNFKLKCSARSPENHPRKPWKHHPSALSFGQSSDFSHKPLALRWHNNLTFGSDGLGALKYKQFVTKKHRAGSKKTIRNLQGLKVYQFTKFLGSWKTSSLFCWKLLCWIQDFLTTCQQVVQLGRHKNCKLRTPEAGVHLLMTQLRCLLKVPPFFSLIFFWGGKKLWEIFESSSKFLPWPQVCVGFGSLKNLGKYHNSARSLANSDTPPKIGWLMLQCLCKYIPFK